MITPKSIKSVTKMVLFKVRDASRPLLRIVEHGDQYYCPCCETSLRRLKPYGVVPRANAMCGVCGSLERDRLMHLFITEQTNLYDRSPKKLLHIAPEPMMARLFRRAEGVDYLSADLFDVRAMVKMDITDIQYPDDTFDVVYCSHVLEHVPDDRRAMREFRRVLKPTGWAILQVPITADTTFEDLSVTDPKERERLFGQYDHVRCYGPDYKDRLIEAGFHVDAIEFAKGLDDETVRRLGLVRDECVYLCRKERPVKSTTE